MSVILCESVYFVCGFGISACMIRYEGRCNSWSKMMWVHCVEKFCTEVRFGLQSCVNCCNITFYLACEVHNSAFDYQQAGIVRWKC